MRIVVEPLWYETSSAQFVRRPETGTPLAPYTHQVKMLEEVRKALRDRKTTCILNASATGSGKTLANFAAAILDGTPTCGVYPTNELLADQYVSLYPYLPALQMAVSDSEGMDDVMAARPFMRSHAHALDWTSNDFAPTAILTNPDVLHLALYSLYGQMLSTFDSTHGASAFRHILSNYPVIAFDEFHLYNAKQVANAAFLVGMARALAPDLPHVFIFSSATPHDQLGPYLRRLGVRPTDVTARPAAPSPTARVVCEEVEVNLLPANLLGWQGSAALLGAWEREIRGWADAASPQARGVFIIDSVYEAKAVAEVMREAYGAKAVGEVHGYMDPGARGGALQRRLSVGTTTIDVGVDLTGRKSKEFLAAEARCAPQGVQRLGRLGRRGRRPGEIAVPNRAWLAVPEYVYAYLQGRQAGTARIDRSTFSRWFTAAYVRHEQFLPYRRLYAPLEAVAACERYLAQEFGDARAEKERRLHFLVPTLYSRRAPSNQEQAEASYARYRAQQQTTWQEFGTEVRALAGQPPPALPHYLSDLESFRGGLESDLAVALYDDLDEALGVKPVKTYALPFVLRRTVWQELSARQFQGLVRRRHPQRAEEWLGELAREGSLLGYLHVTGLVRGKANAMAFEIRKSSVNGRFQQVIRLNGLSLVAEGGQWRCGADSIRGRMQARWMNCWISEQHSSAVARRRFLQPLFKVYPLRAASSGGNADLWSVAFGLDAFFLDSISVRDAAIAQQRSE